MRIRTITLSVVALVVFTASAGPNANAKLLIDLTVNTPLVDSVAPASAGTLTVGIICKGVTNIDTYSFDMVFDPTILSFQAAVVENPIGGLTNILKKNGGQTINAPVGLKRGCTDTININNTLEGLPDSAKAPEGDGLLGLVVFNVIRTIPCTIALKNAVFLDYEGVKDSTMVLSNARIISQATAVKPMHSGAGKVSMHTIGLSPAFPGTRNAALGKRVIDICGRTAFARENADGSIALPAGMYIIPKR